MTLFRLGAWLWSLDVLGRTSYNRQSRASVSCPGDVARAIHGVRPIVELCLFRGPGRKQVENSGAAGNVDSGAGA